MVKNPPSYSGDIRDMGSIPGSRRSPGGEHVNPLQCSCLENPMDREPGGLQSMRLLSQTRLKRLSRQHFFSEGNREGHAAMTAYGKGMGRRGYFHGLNSFAPSVLSS